MSRPVAPRPLSTINKSIHSQSQSHSLAQRQPHRLTGRFRPVDRHHHRHHHHHHYHSRGSSGAAAAPFCGGPSTTCTPWSCGSAAATPTAWSFPGWSARPAGTPPPKCWLCHSSVGFCDAWSPWSWFGRDGPVPPCDALERECCCFAAAALLK